MEFSTSQFEVLDLSIDEILLDPNNPRFADISDDEFSINKDRYEDETIQQETLSKMLHPKFDVDSLIKSIETVGFLPIDSVVVRKNKEKYVVIEGNRRIAAIKKILINFKKGQSLLKEKEIETFKIIKVLNLNSENTTFDMIVQGVRNVSGIKEWDAFQKAQLIYRLKDIGETSGNISRMIGSSIKEIDRYFKTYNVMTQFKNDETYGTNWKPKYFSYFDEILKKPSLREYFGWNEQTYKFDNLSNIQRFYDWLLPDEDNTTLFNDAKDIRRLADFINDSRCLEFLDDKNLDKAISYIEHKNNNISKVISFEECLAKINLGLDSLKLIISEDYENQLSDDDIKILNDKVEDFSKKLKKIENLRKNV